MNSLLIQRYTLARLDLSIEVSFDQLIRLSLRSSRRKPNFKIAISCFLFQSVVIAHQPCLIQLTEARLIVYTLLSQPSTKCILKEFLSLQDQNRAPAISFLSSTA